jgi:cyclopropane fatty-acyl-phospholipid synthase-like methyltransferase
VDARLRPARFPRSAGYHPDWMVAAASSAANALWLTEWLCEALELRPGMRVLDLGCGRAMSSVFLRREFGVEVWAADLWFSPTENLQRVRDAGVADGVFPLRADARALPFADGFFDAIVSVDSFMYYGTDELYLNALARLVKPGGQVGIAQVGLAEEFDGDIPTHLRAWWDQDRPWFLHTAAWWRRHWEKTGIVAVETADRLADGWTYWRDWLREVAPHNTVEIDAIEADAGRNLGYVRVVGRRRADVVLHDAVASIPAQYEAKPLRREG